MNGINSHTNQLTLPAYAALTNSNISIQRQRLSSSYSLNRWLGESKAEQPWGQTSPRGFAEKLKVTGGGNEENDGR